MTVYKVTNLIDQKIYVGATSRNLQERWKEHCRHNKTPFNQAIQKYGKENFLVEVIEKANSIEEMNELEMFYIKKFNSILPNGYNACEGGGKTKGYNHTEESKAKMKEAKDGMYLGKENPFFNKHHSEEQIAKWKRDRKGRKLTEEWKLNVAKANYKKVVNLETKEVFESMRAAGEAYHRAPTNIVRACKHPQRTAAGYHWGYYELQDNTVPSLGE